MTSISGDAWGKLVVCLVIDALGSSSFLIPGLGELSDGGALHYLFLQLNVSR